MRSAEASGGNAIDELGARRAWTKMRWTEMQTWPEWAKAAGDGAGDAIGEIGVVVRR